MNRKLIAITFLSSLLAAFAGCSRSDPGALAPDAGKAAFGGGDPASLQTERALAAGPFTFQRIAPGQSGTIRPRVDELVFDLAEPGLWEPGFFLRLQSGRGPKSALTSAVVMLNGEVVLGPGDFHGLPTVLEVPVALLGRNVLGVKILGSPDSTCEIVIEGVLLGEPHARVLYPYVPAFSATIVPLTLRVSCEGWIGDDPDVLPRDFRTLMIPAVWNGMTLQTWSDYEAHVADLVDAANPEWSDWQPYAPTVEERSRLYPGLSDGGYYLFAAQVRDAAGRVSTITDYRREVLWMRASGNSFRPDLMVFEETLGGVSPAGQTIPVASGQVLAFSWLASGAGYNGLIATYRHGWDLLDPDDALDPGWAVEPGLEPANLAAEPVGFATGRHMLTIRVEDDFGQVRIGRVAVEVQPVAARRQARERAH